MNIYSNRQTQPAIRSLPTRQQLEAFLRSQGRNSKKLGQMSSWEQIQLTNEYHRYTEQTAAELL